jgi:diguanylate cyclase (GGDEF)-like protein/PAS domain S-box-containing protein
MSFENGRRPGGKARDQSVAAHELLREAEERFRLAFDHAPIGMALVKPDGSFMRVNQSLCEIVGHDAATLRAMTFQELTHPEDVDADVEFRRQMLVGERRTYQTEKRYFHADGHVVQIMLSVSMVRSSDGSPQYFITHLEDITARKELENQLRYLATHDEMTGLYNRRRFDEELQRQVAYATRFGHQAALLMLDLDSFKEINDTAGHSIGDELVKGVGGRLKARLRETDVLGRIGGDEFAVFLPEVAPDQAERVAAQLVDQIARDPVMAGSMPLWTRASIGVAIFDPKSPTDASGLLRQADAAMYEAKHAGGHQIAIARPADSLATEPTEAGR